MVRANGFRVRTESTRSTLIHGTGETSRAMLAFALAQKVNPGFAWARCAQPGPLLGSKVRELLATHALEGRIAPIDPSELARPEVGAETFNALVASATYRNMLLELLRLPPLLQGVVPYPFQEGERPTLVLADTQALPEVVRHGSLEDAGLHETLHHARVTLIATWEGTPPPLLKSRFDRVFAVEEVATAPWGDARVWSDHGRLETDPLEAQPMATAWRRLALDPQLLHV